MRLLYNSLHKLDENYSLVALKHVVSLACSFNKYITLDWVFIESVEKGLLTDAKKNYWSLLRLVVKVAEIAFGSQEDANVAEVATLVELSIFIGTILVHDVDCATEYKINFLAAFISYLNIRYFRIFDELKIVVEIILWVLHTKVLES